MEISEQLRRRRESKARYKRSKKGKVVEAKYRKTKKRRQVLRRYNGSDKRKSVQLKYDYGITLEEYEQMLNEQDGKCAICGTEPGGTILAVDHEHNTGKIRGLLCSLCNAGLGQFKDSPELLQKATRYLHGN